jgi:hypothetical protein
LLYVLVMTTAERLRREGAAEGEARGEARGKREALLLLLRQRFGRLTAGAVAAIGKAEAAELDVWFRRALTAASLEEVLSAKIVMPRSKAASPRRAQPRVRA